MSRIRLIPAVTALTLACSMVSAHDGDRPGHHQSPTTSPGGAKAANVTIHDFELVNQDGKRVMFGRDVVSDRIVVMEFFYTRCTTICPVSSALLAEAQDDLVEHLGDDVWFISISVDPVNDTPARLRAYAKAHQAGSGWIWLTGKKALVDKVLTGVGAYTADFTDHPSMILVGDARTGAWQRLFGLPDPERVVAEIKRLLDGRQHHSASHLSRSGE